MSFFVKAPKVNPAGLDSINSLIGAVTLTAGANITLTPVGNDITIAASGGGGGADTALSNLTSPTSINQNLLFGAAGKSIGDTTNQPAFIHVTEVNSGGGLTLSADVLGITLRAGNDTIDYYSFAGAAAPKINFWDTVSTNSIGLTLPIGALGADFTLNLPAISGTLVASSSSATADVATADVTVDTGAQTTALNTTSTGSVIIKSGDINNADATAVTSTGDILFESGRARSANDVASTVNTGQVTIKSQSVDAGLGISGDVVLLTGNSPNNSGNVSLTTGTSGATRGSITLDALSIIPKTDILFDSGATAVIKTKDEASTTTKNIELKSGAILTGPTGDSGTVTIGSGYNFTGTGGNSGAVLVRSGDADATTGDINITTGDSADGDTGNIILTTGNPLNTRGIITLNAPAVVMPSAAANPSTTTEGAMYFYSNGVTYNLRVYLNGGWRSVLLT
jgi:hypothetical protein